MSQDVWSFCTEFLTMRRSCSDTHLLLKHEHQPDADYPVLLNFHRRRTLVKPGLLQLCSQWFRHFRFCAVKHRFYDAICLKCWVLFWEGLTFSEFSAFYCPATPDPLFLMFRRLKTYFHSLECSCAYRSTPQVEYIGVPCMAVTVDRELEFDSGEGDRNGYRF